MTESDWQPRLTNDFSHFVGPVLERLEVGGRTVAALDGIWKVLHTQE
jgi:hypothetical protein